MGSIFEGLERSISYGRESGTDNPELDKPYGFEGSTYGSKELEGVYRYDPSKDQMYKEMEQKKSIKDLSKAMGAYKDSSKVKPVKNTQKLDTSNPSGGRKGYREVSSEDYKGKTAEELREAVMALVKYNLKSSVMGSGKGRT
jgi:hypothetical protein|tara:strand:+ start:269 stop:694 length:426 start_codon:yes stop_codon:yes gene_type:complete